MINDVIQYRNFDCRRCTILFCCFRRVKG